MKYRKLVIGHRRPAPGFKKVATAIKPKLPWIYETARTLRYDASTKKYQEWRLHCERAGYVDNEML